MKSGRVTRRGPLIQLKLVEQKKLRAQESPILGIFTHEGEREKRVRDSIFPLRSTGFGWSGFVGVRGKLHLLDKSFAWKRETRDFADIPRGGFGKSKFSIGGSTNRTS